MIEVICLDVNLVYPISTDSLNPGWLSLGDTSITPVKDPSCPPNVYYVLPI